MAGKNSSARIHVGTEKATIAEKGTENFGKVDYDDTDTVSSDGDQSILEDEKKTEEEDINYDVASSSYYTGSNAAIHEDKKSPDDNLELQQKFGTLSVGNKASVPTPPVVTAGSQDSLASMGTRETGEPVLPKEDGTQAMSSSDGLQASAPLGVAKIEPFAENREAAKVPSKGIYSSESLVKHNPEEWMTDGPTFLSFADEQCHSNPDQCRRVKQGIIYNKEICPIGKEYRKGKEWHLGERLGSGSFGVVYKCKSSLTGDFHAVKQVQKGDVRLDEIRLWQRLGRHPNVCELYAVTFEEDSEEDFFWFHMELVLFADQPAQHLSSYVSTLNPSVQIPLPALLMAGSGLFSGIGHMHGQKITHRDLCYAKNIMVGTGFQFKIIDFSFIREVTEDQHYDKDLKGGLACFILLATKQKKHPDNWTKHAVELCIKGHAEADMLLPLCQRLMSHLEYRKGDAMKVAGWMAEEIDRLLAYLVPEAPENPES